MILHSSGLCIPTRSGTRANVTASTKRDVKIAATVQVMPPSFFVIGSRAVAALGHRSRPGEYLPAIREGYRRAKREMGTVPGPKALDRDHISGLHRILSPALPVEHVRRAALQRPVHHLAVLAFHIHIQIDVGVHELHLGNYSG